MIGVRVDSRKAQIRIAGLRENLENLRPVFVNFHAYMLNRVSLQFARLRKGGEFRGEKWSWFAPLYTRADGTVIPAYGGVPKVRGKGRVLGRLRHSGKRVTPSSSVVQDTAVLRNAALNIFRISHGGRRVEMDTSARHAAYQHRLRPFQFFEDPRDVDTLRKMLLRKLEGGQP